jgi:hypothetical protein
MIEKAVTRRALRNHAQSREDLAFWLARPAEERVAAVDTLRRRFYGRTTGLQRSARVVQRARG